MYSFYFSSSLCPRVIIRLSDFDEADEASRFGGTMGAEDDDAPGPSFAYAEEFEDILAREMAKQAAGAKESAWETERTDGASGGRGGTHH